MVLKKLMSSSYKKAQTNFNEIGGMILNVVLKELMSYSYKKLKQTLTKEWVKIPRRGSEIAPFLVQEICIEERISFLKRNGLKA